MRYAQVNPDGLVVNIMICEAAEIDAFRPIFAPDELIEAPDEVGPGWTYVGGEWSAPPDPTEPLPDPEPR